MKNTIISIIISILSILFCVFVYWCGGGNFERGEKLQEICVASFSIGFFIFVGSLSLCSFINEEI